MAFKNALSYAKELLVNVIKPGDIVVDATAGNGHDTLFLAKLVGEAGHVFAFDVQAEAIKSTEERLKQADIFPRTTIILDSHANVSTYLQDEITAAIFNLGYLPGSNHDIITQGNSTIKAIESLLDLLKVGGIIILVVYHGHPGGREEKVALLDYVGQLNPSYLEVLSYQFLNQQNDPPFVIAIEKKKTN